MQSAVSQNRAFLARISRRIQWKGVLALLMLLLAVVFFRSERKELHAILPQIRQANPIWLLAGSFVTTIFLVFEAGMYKRSFSAIGLFFSWSDALLLFLKRNFVSVFLPAGGISTLVYTPAELRKQPFNQSQIYQAGGLFGFAGILTTVIVGIPVIIYTVVSTDKFKDSWLALSAAFVLLIVLFLGVQSIKAKGRLYRWMDRRVPAFTPTLNELFSANVNTRTYGGAILFSVGVELCGVAHLYIAMLALGAPASISAAAAGYIMAVLLMVVSPFLKGLGAVEMAMVYVLEQFGYSPVEALSVTIIYRVFEFWLPLLIGFICFSWKGRKIFFRILPALLTFSLGIVNIVSVITPPLRQRMRVLLEYLPLNAIHASNILVLLIGLGLLATSAFLIRGFRAAWVLAVVFSVFSLLGHLAKAFDYEEAIISFIIVLILVSTERQYRIRSSNKWMNTGISTVVLVFFSVLVFGFISFYFIDFRHFGIDFTWKQSLLHMFKLFLLTEDASLHPITRFGHEFIWLIRTLGFLTWAFLLVTLLKPYRPTKESVETYKEKATFILHQYGNSSNDYFKLSKDKLFFISEIYDAFFAYRISGGFAIVLEEPVCAAEHKVDVIREFDRQCRRMGLKPAFYRVDENSIPWFSQLKKHRILIGQEAILDVNSFSLDGKEKKSLRNGLNGLLRKGYITNVYSAPHAIEFIDQLKTVSDNWLEDLGIGEHIFSQGMFDPKELMSQDIIVVEDERGNVQAFLNIIPDYADDECTYDLIRKTTEAPGAAVDALIVRLIEYARQKTKQFINLGLVPMTGMDQPDNMAEHIIKIAADRIKRFQRYKGQREFKEKYATWWENKYLVFDNDFDLLQLPTALNNVMKA